MVQRTLVHAQASLFQIVVSANENYVIMFMTCKKLSYRLENRASAWCIRLIIMLLSGICLLKVYLYVTCWTYWLKIAHFPTLFLLSAFIRGDPFRISVKALRILKPESFTELTVKIVVLVGQQSVTDSWTDRHLCLSYKTWGSA